MSVKNVIKFLLCLLGLAAFSYTGLSQAQNNPSAPSEPDKNIQDDAKNVKKKGIYGASSADAMEENATPAEEVSPERKKLMARYPLSQTSRTEINQVANTHIQEGIIAYNKSKAIFDAVKEVDSNYDTTSTLLTVKNKTILETSLEPQDVVQLGPEKAFWAVRVRGLNVAMQQITSALNSFNQASKAVPDNQTIKKWIKIATDTRQALQFHIKYHQLAYKASKINIPEDQRAEFLEDLGRNWSSTSEKPVESISVRVRTRSMGLPPETEKETTDIKSLQDNLPDLTFEKKEQ